MVQRIVLEQFEQIHHISRGKTWYITSFFGFFFLCGQTLSGDRKMYIQRILLEKFAKIHYILREKVLKSPYLDISS